MDDFAGATETEGAAAARAPAAIFASIAVMLAAAGFIGFALSRQPADIAAPEIARPAATVSAAGEAKPLTPTPVMPGAAIAEPARAAGPDATLTGAGAAFPVVEDAAANASEDLAAFWGPRLKPTAVNAAPAQASVAPTVMRLSRTRLADASMFPPPFFSSSDLEPRPAPPPPALAYEGDLPAAPQEMTIALAKGETFVDALRRAGVRAEDRNAAAYAFGDDYNLRRLRPGQEFTLIAAPPNKTLFQEVSSPADTDAFLVAMRFRVDAENRIELKRLKDGEFESEKAVAPLTTRLASMKGRINGSLYQSAKAQGAPDDVIANLANMFAYDVDFQRDIFGGDEFEAIFEIKYDETGREVGGGEILYGRLAWRNRAKEKGYYRFESAEGGGKADYFDAKGESARRLLMKTPIDGARLSSGFGTRRHPILGYMKAHKGVDFAAPRGTPIKAAGDGVIERAGPYGSFGNYVKIRHASGYKTAYAHLNAIRRGIRSGVRVRQGDIIGYVGSTGRSTGPHLHYEVHYKDAAVNPKNLKVATGVELSGAELKAFQKARADIDAMREVAADEAPLLADNQRTDNSL